MAKFNVNWNEHHVVEIEADDEGDARRIWECGYYDRDDECIDVGTSDIAEIEE